MCVRAPFTRYKSTRSTTWVKDDQVIVISMLTVIFSKEEDIAAYTIKAVDDPRTLNKVLSY